MADRLAPNKPSPRARSAAPHRVILYGKPECHLCEIAEQLLIGLGREFSLTIEKVDVRSDAVLLAQYGDRIPVISIDGRVLLAAPIRSQDLRSALV